MGGARLVLASASPRRRELLRAAGVEFELAPVDVDETLEHFETPHAAALELARRKARACLALRAAPTHELVLGADTVVALPRGARWHLLGKPADAQEARAMLGALSDTRHAVVTGVCVLRGRDGAEAGEAATTWVRMRALTPAEIEAYAVSCEWRDKAGGYAIQETADRFVTELTGAGFDNVVGLPVALALGLVRGLSES
ncbi:MAG TPA: Maf family protein [Planctomycetota bacterium]|nr:Maf family protein [Planctomycetota bacterium]